MAGKVGITLATILVLIGAGVWLLVSSFRDDSHTGYTVVMRPALPPSASACKAEVARLRITFVTPDCTPSGRRAWFVVTVRNVSDSNGFPVCMTTAYAKDGQALFDRAIPIWVVGGEPSGPPVQRGTTVRLVWYFDDHAHDSTYVQHATWAPVTIDHYTASCHGRPDSQVPI